MRGGTWTRRSGSPDVAPSGRGGFTIVEILVSIVLLTTGLLGLSVVVRTAGQGMAAELAQLRAVAAAEELMEGALASGFVEGRGEIVGAGVLLTWSTDASGLTEARLIVRGRVGKREIVDSLVRLVGTR